MSKQWLNFSKYSHLGNDFILFDNRKGSFPVKPSLVAALCDRHLGIGGDGVVLFEESDVSDFKMRIFNSDGSEAKSCGNALLCLMSFMIYLGGELKKDYSIETKGGIVHLKQVAEKVILTTKRPILLVASKEIKIGNECFLYDLIDSGVPHAVIFVEDPSSIDVEKIGSQIRFYKDFQPEGANVDFAVFTNDEIVVRTFERGLEKESLACGTGALASAFAASLKFNLKKETIKVHFKLGDVEIVMNEEFYLKGVPQFLFTGKVNLKTYKL